MANLASINAMDVKKDFYKEYHERKMSENNTIEVVTDPATVAAITRKGKSASSVLRSFRG